MKCKNCGGELIFQNGTGVCESCKNTYRLDYGFENTEVYICYTESDAQGRRTKDSIIAEELYQKLESKKIYTFYERRSAPALIGDDLQAANYQAIYHAKIILVVGASATRFEHLVSKHDKYFGDKTVIPIYTDIRPEDLPPELNRVQALNLNSIGADVDLLNGILRLLGREKEINLESLHQHTVKRKKIAAIILSLFLIIGIAAAAVLLLFRESQAEPESEPVLTSQEIYDNAQALMESGDYLGAADSFATIPDFRNSTNLLNEIYNRYDGYYLSEDKSVSFYINIQDAATVNLILEKTINGQKVRIEESSVLDNHTITASFTDSENNIGEMTITLNNNDINLITTLESESEPLSIGNLNLTFLLSQRSDRPMEHKITSETLQQWMTNRTSLGELNRTGYQLEFYKTMTAGGGINNHFAGYQIVNTDIKLLLADFDLSSAKSHNDMEKYPLDDFYIVGVIAPVELVCPQEIGGTPHVYDENKILYAPNVQDFILMSDLESGSPEYCVFFTFNESEANAVIDSNSMIGITSQVLIGNNFSWVERDLKENFIEVSVLSQFKKSHSETTQYYAGATVVAEKSNMALICVTCNCPDCTNKYYYYKKNTETSEIRFVTELLNNSYIGQIDMWENYPELFDEFL